MPTRSTANSEGSACPTPGDQGNAHAGSPGIDATVPSIARCYDALLGGKDNYEADRGAVAQALAIAPGLASIAEDNRRFLARVTRYLAKQAGIDQFLDCGSGLPTAENTHEVAQQANPEAEVVYVDSDPIVLAHGRALLEDSERTKFVAADLTDPEQVLGHPDVAARIDFDRPVALYQVSTLHHVGPWERPHDIVAAYRDALPAGSYLVLSHFVDPGEEQPDSSELARVLQERIFAEGVMGRGWFRTRDEITAFFDGFELLDPGVVLLADWYPGGPRSAPLKPEQYLALGGLGRVPG